jgi:hypothetical protein
MKLTTFTVVAALAAPLVQAAPADLRVLVDRQTRPRKLSMVYLTQDRYSIANASSPTGALPSPATIH